MTTVHERAKEVILGKYKGKNTKEDMIEQGYIKQME